MAIKRACNRPQCSFSFTPGETNLTFGHGALYADGTWEFPCITCADAAREAMPQVIRQTRERLLEKGNSAAVIEEYLETTGWLNNPILPEPEDLVNTVEEAEALLLATV